MSHPRVPVPRFSRSETARAEAFSDGVFAIAVTILVLGLATPAHQTGDLGRALARQWPSYLGYVASFSYIAVIWLNHHQAFVRIRSMDRGLHAANLFLLFTTAALPFPTAVVAEALKADVFGGDARIAVALYSGIAAAMCLSWTMLYHHLGRHPELVDDSVEPDYVRHGLIRSRVGMLVYAVLGVVGYLVTPLIALVGFLVLPAFYFVTSEGLPGGRDAAAG
ncbi:TMEM175 family protein [Streptomyces sp. NBC_01190]|uniref:TMEM175 family protein n=1 Tax=Streptomyces sp. NBC_01190 TaxID=2903767 RepID=UPI00386E74E5|nr:TMEM175 family protein [Streptomyces sp. NBC_01190]